MDDLISRKAVLDIILGELGFRCGYDADIALLSVKKCVSELPTAYDVEKVVEELEEIDKKTFRMSPKDAIDIVKRGGVE